MRSSSLVPAPLLPGQRLLFGKLQCTKYTDIFPSNTWTSLSAEVKGLLTAVLKGKHPKGALVFLKSPYSFREKVIFVHEWKDATLAELHAFKVRKAAAVKKAEAQKIREQNARAQLAARRLKASRLELREILRKYPQLHEEALRQIDAFHDKVVSDLAASGK